MEGIETKKLTLKTNKSNTDKTEHRILLSQNTISKTNDLTARSAVLDGIPYTLWLSVHGTISYSQGVELKKQQSSNFRGQTGNLFQKIN